MLGISTSNLRVGGYRKSSGIDVDAVAIYSRIIADGGVSDLTRLNFFVKGLKTIYGSLTNVPVCYDAHWIGYKLGSGTGATAGQAVAKLYTISVIQTVSDSDAQAFIYRVYNAGGELTNTEASAVNQLVLDMKAAGVWTSMKAVYPMVGASAAACAQNLKSSSFTGTFNGGWTYANTGVTPNGTNAFMDSNLNASGNLTANNWHLSYYSRTNNAVSVDFDFGTGDALGNFSSSLFLRRSGNTSAFDSGNASGNFRISTTITDSTGFFVGKITSSSDRKYIRNNSVIASSTTTNSNVLQSYNLYLAAYNQIGTALYFGSKQCAFSSIGDGLNDTQASDFYTAVQAFQTTLNRQII